VFLGRAGCRGLDDGLRPIVGHRGGGLSHVVGDRLALEYG
jgi:hypothetical protein